MRINLIKRTTYPKCNNSINFNNRMPVLKSNPKDTVSFKSRNNFVSTLPENFYAMPLRERVDCLHKNFYEYIKPIMIVTKADYYKTCHIGYKAQEALKEYTKQNTDFILKTYDLGNPGSNPNTKAFRMYIELSDKLKNNKNTLEKSKKLANNEFFADSTELKEKIKKAQIHFDQSDDLSKLEEFTNYYENEFETLGKELKSLNIKNFSPQTYRSLKYLEAQKNTSIIHILNNPHGDCIKLEKELAELKANSKDYDAKLKKTEELKKLSDNIIKNYDVFCTQIPKLNAFLTKNENIEVQIPTKNELKAIYKQMSREADYFSKNCTDNIQKFCDNGLSKINTTKINEIIKEQDKALDDINKTIIDIKNQIYEKSNEEFFKNYNIK